MTDSDGFVTVTSRRARKQKRKEELAAVEQRARADSTDAEKEALRSRVAELERELDDMRWSILGHERTTPVPQDTPRATPPANGQSPKSRQRVPDDPILASRRKHLSFPSPIAAVRLLVGVIHTFIFSVLVLLAVPLNVLNPVMRRLGIFTTLADTFARLYGRWLCIILGIKVKVIGEKNLPKNGESAIVMFNHSSNIDPLILLGYGPPGLRFIAKREVLWFPLIGIAMYVAGHVLINRKNREDSIRRMRKGAREVMPGSHIALAPEGTRSKSGKLLPFKKGPFYLAKEFARPILPCVMFGANDVWPVGCYPTEGEVVLQIMPIVTGTAKMDVERASERVRRSMEYACARPPHVAHSYTQPTVTALFFVVCCCFPLWVHYMWLGEA